MQLIWYLHPDWIINHDCPHEILDKGDIKTCQHWRMQQWILNDNSIVNSEGQRDLKGIDEGRGQELWKNGEWMRQWFGGALQTWMRNCSEKGTPESVGNPAFLLGVIINMLKCKVRYQWAGHHTSSQRKMSFAMLPSQCPAKDGCSDTFHGPCGPP